MKYTNATQWIHTKKQFLVHATVCTAWFKAVKWPVVMLLFSTSLPLSAQNALEDIKKNTPLALHYDMDSLSVGANAAKYYKKMYSLASPPTPNEYQCRYADADGQFRTTIRTKCSPYSGLVFQGWTRSPIGRTAVPPGITPGEGDIFVDRYRRMQRWAGCKAGPFVYSTPVYYRYTGGKWYKLDAASVADYSPPGYSGTPSDGEEYTDTNPNPDVTYKYSDGAWYRQYDTTADIPIVEANKHIYRAEGRNVYIWIQSKTKMRILYRDEGYGADGEKTGIGKLTDRSGNGYDAYTIGVPAIYEKRSVGNKNALVFDGKYNQYYITEPALSLVNSSYTIFATVQRTGAKRLNYYTGTEWMPNSSPTPYKRLAAGFDGSIRYSHSHYTGSISANIPAYTNGEGASQWVNRFGKDKGKTVWQNGKQVGQGRGSHIGQALQSGTEGLTVGGFHYYGYNAVFKGRITGNFYVFKDSLSSAQVVLLQNYEALNPDMPALTANDLFDEVAATTGADKANIDFGGIYKAQDDSEVTTATSGTLTLSGATSLDKGDALVAAHNNAAGPLREWYLDETGDVGFVDLAFEGLTPGDYHLQRYQAPNWIIVRTATATGTILTFPGVRMTDGRYRIKDQKIVNSTVFNAPDWNGPAPGKDNEQTVNAATAAAGVAFGPNAVNGYTTFPNDPGIVEIRMDVSGVFDTTGEMLVIGDKTIKLFESSYGTFTIDTDPTEYYFTYQYTAGAASGKKLRLLRSGNAALTGGEADKLLRSMKYKNTVGSTSGRQDGKRVLTSFYVDSNGDEFTATSTATILLDREIEYPDLNAGDPAVRNYQKTTHDASTGIPLAVDVLKPTDTDIVSIIVSLEAGSKSDSHNETLALPGGTVEIDLLATTDKNGNFTFNSTAYNYDYKAALKKLTITAATSGNGINGDDIKGILEALRYKNADTDAPTAANANMDGIRKFAVYYTDKVNTSKAAYSELLLERTSVSVAVVSATVKEQTPEEKTGFTIRLAQAVSQDVTVNYTMSGTAVSGTDYTTSPGGSATISTGTTETTVEVAVIDDTKPESDETIILTLTSVTGPASLLSDTVQRSATVTIEQNDINPAVIAAVSNPICSGTKSQLNQTKPTNAGTPYKYRWESSVDGSNFTPIANSDTQNYTSPDLTKETWYKRIDSVDLQSVKLGIESNTVKIAVNPTPAVADQTPPAVCSSAALDYELNKGITNGISSSFKWKAADNPKVTGESLTEQTTAEITNTLINTTTTAQQVVYTVTPKSTLSGNCTGASFKVTVTVNPTPEVSDQTTPVCSGTALDYELNKGITNDVSSTFRWKAADNPNVTGESLTEQTTAKITNTLINTTTRAQQVVYTVTSVSAVSGNCPGVSFKVIVTVNPLPVAPVVTTPVVYCADESASKLTATAAPGNKLLWYTTPTGGDGSANAPVPKTDSATPPLTSYWVSQTDENSCESPRAEIVVKINRLTPGVVARNQTLSENQIPGIFTETTPPKGIGIPSYQWQKSTVSDSQGFYDIPGAVSDTYSPEPVLQDTWYKRVDRFKFGGRVCSGETNVLKLTVNRELDLLLEKQLIDDAGVAIDTPKFSIGSRAIFKITVTNNGLSEATGVTVKESLPNGYSYIKYRATQGAYDEETTLWKVGSVDSGSKAAIEIEVKVLSTGDYLNTAEVKSDQDDPDELNNVASAYIVIDRNIVSREFSPNGDGKNDVFWIENITSFPGNQLTVYNRQGIRVYTKRNYTNDWEGDKLPEGTYYYMLDLNDGRKPDIGWLYIKR